MTTVSVMQPAYLGWTGYFDLIDQADLFVLLDTVPVSKQSWQTRNRILVDGKVTWLSIPVRAEMGQLLTDVRIADALPWRRKHKRTIQQAYPNQDCLEPLLALYDHPHKHLSTFTGTALRVLCKILGIETPIVAASAYELPFRTNPLDRLAYLLAHTGATGFLTAAGSGDYLTPDSLPVPTRFHAYEPQPYEQGGPWVSHLSVVDALGRLGPEATLDLIRGGRK